MKTLLKFILWLAWVITTGLMFSCSTVHKNISSTKTAVDSVTTLAKDTSSVVKVVDQNSNFNAKGVDITVDFGADTTKMDSVKPAILTNLGDSNDSSEENFQKLITQAVSSYATPGKIPYSIHIHIDSVGTSTQNLITSDSSNLKEKSIVAIKSNTQTNTKVVSKSGLSFGTYAIIGLVVIIGIAIFVIKKFIF